jgi:predicted DNA-binding ribbon-helix-helix protein|tara:strand:- start:6676 stop:7149 length:474 start_codon:yes stop_codon:yes gene_type:complete
MLCHFPCHFSCHPPRFPRKTAAPTTILANKAAISTAWQAGKGNFMCKIYSGTDPALYETATRSVRINGVVTSLRLEQRFWQIIDEIAVKDGYSTPQFLGLLHDEVVAHRGDIPNFASLLRVVCTVYLQQQQQPHPVAGNPRRPGPLNHMAMQAPLGQ